MIKGIKIKNKQNNTVPPIINIRTVSEFILLEVGVDTVLEWTMGGTFA